MRQNANRIMTVLLGGVLALDVSAAYRRGEELWKCDFSRESIARLGCKDIAPGRNWQADEGVKGDGAFHVKCGDAGCKVGFPLPTEKFRGRIIQIETNVKGLDVRRGPRGFNGPKVMYPFKSGGRTFYPELPKEYGSWDWKKGVKVDLIPKDAEGMVLVLGLENSAGELWIDDIVIYAAEEVPDEPPAVTPPNPKADAIARGPYAAKARCGGFRGVMSPGDREMTEDDVRTLAEWNANLVRRQINVPRPPSAQDDEWYFRGLSARLDRLEREMKLFRKYGIRVCIDLHSGPSTTKNKHAGNTLPADYDTAELRRAWRMIAERFAGDPSVYGYDIMNEPAVSPQAWDRIFRETVAEIRKVDRRTPVVTEFLRFFYPEEMNVIYSPHTLTHFGVGGIGTVRWSYGNYVNGEFLDKNQLRVYMETIIDFSLRHPSARLFVGEFSCILWSKGAEGYIRDCIELFEEYGWDWTYHAYREWPPWDVEYTHDANYTVGKAIKAKTDTARKRELLKGLGHNPRPAK